ncbi:MAG: hypothetical protein KAJ50_03720 [Bacteroidales bacterium]|nr:hypothetical protein [Bacteroidales bacterium]
MHVSNALIQSGFIDEAEKYINKSLEYNPENLFSEYVKAYILYAKNRDLAQLRQSLITTLQRDSTRLDIIQEVGKAYYYLGEYDGAYAYYKKFNEIREAYKLDVYAGENAKIGLVFSEMGLKEESEKYFANYKNYADNDKSIYKDLSLAAYYSFHGNTDAAIEHLRLFSQQDNYFYWMVIFIEMDPLFDNIKDHPEFRKILDDIEIKFWNYHEQIKASLEEKELL